MSGTSCCVAPWGLSGSILLVVSFPVQLHIVFEELHNVTFTIMDPPHKVDYGTTGDASLCMLSSFLVALVCSHGASMEVSLIVGSSGLKQEVERERKLSENPNTEFRWYIYTCSRT